MQDVTPLDWHRMFLGDLGLLFLVEIVIRTTIMYVFTYALIRVVSRRANAQISLMELLLVIGLGSAVGDPMFYPQVPLLHAMLVVLVVIALTRGHAALVKHSTRAEEILEGQPRRVLEHGLIDLRALRGAGVGVDELHRQLRQQGFSQLGQVRVAYVEDNGSVSPFGVVEDPLPGLPIEPPLELVDADLVAGDTAESGGRYACRTCGRVAELAAGASPGECEVCSGDEWMRAVEDAHASA